MTSGDDTHVAASSAGQLLTRALTRESGRARQLLAAGEWRRASSDAEAAAAVLARLTAPLQTQRSATARTSATVRDRRLQRILRTTLHHLDAGAVSPPTAALLTAVARALLPWHAHPNPPVAAAAPRYGAVPRSSDGVAVAPTEAGEALLPDLTALFTTLAATCPPVTVPLTPSAVPWQVPYAGRFRRHGRPAPGVWTAETVGCPGCGGTAGATPRQALPALAAETCCIVSLGAALGLAVATPALLGTVHGPREQLGMPVELLVAWPWVTGAVAGCLRFGTTATVLPAGTALRRMRWVRAGEKSPQTPVLRQWCTTRPLVQTTCPTHTLSPVRPDLPVY